MKKTLLRAAATTLTALFFYLNPALSQDKIFSDVSSGDITATGKRFITPSQERLIKVDLPALRNMLSNVPMEGPQTADIRHGKVIEIPMPNGLQHRFRIVEYHVLHPDLAARYPDIKTYTGQGIDDPSAFIKINLSNQGFRSMVMSPTGSYFIDPYQEYDVEHYTCYNRNNILPGIAFQCGLEELPQQEPSFREPNIYQRSSGTQLRTYRLALACTGEYTVARGGSVATSLAAMAVTMNRVNGIYETETGIRMVMIPNNDLIIYTNGATDPYTNNNGSAMLSENTSNLQTVIGNANFDIGHVFSTGGGGIASLSSVCSSNKARGVTGQPNPVGDPFDVDYVAHEMGHQFGAGHTFNAITNSCNGNRMAASAYEPGSGITIMAYAGICGINNLASNSIAYFHTKSFDDIVIFSQNGGGNTCAVISATGNTPPNVTSLGSNKSIPISTPFVLTGVASDADNDALTYSWEQYDRGPAGNWNVQSTTAPMFRTFSPVTTPTRTFPKIEDVINNTTTVGELLPNQSRILNFRLTARDNRIGGGGVMHPDDPLVINVVNNGGPFQVTAPNTAINWAGNSVQSVTWDVNGTDQVPISTSHVKISLSTDGGFTFPIVLHASTPNDGSENVTVPNITTSSARVKVEAVDNIFFDMSNANFSITASAAVLTTITTGAVTPSSVCAGDAVQVSYTVDENAIAGNVFTAQLSDASGSFAAPVNIGSVNAVGSGSINAIIPALSSDGNGYRIRVVASNPSVTGSTSDPVTVFAPIVPGAITANGSTQFCAGGSVTLSGNNGGMWNTGSFDAEIIVSETGDYFVTYSNGCGSAQSNTISVTVNNLPTVSIGAAGPLNVTDPPIPLLGNPSGGTFSGAGVSGVTFDPSVAGVGIHQVNYVFTDGNGCTSSDFTFIEVTDAPCIFDAGEITGARNVCTFMDPDGPDGVYTISSTGAASITWIAPPNATLVLGQGTHTATFSFQTNYTNNYIVVKVESACDGSVATVIKNVRPIPAARPGSITGSVNACAIIGTANTALYTIRKVLGGDYYEWTVPAGANIVSHPNGPGENDTIIEVQFDAGFVLGSEISVRAGSYCGWSASRSLVISGSGPANPGGISGPNEVCSFVGNGAAVYTIRKVANAGYYNWTVPAGATIVDRPGLNTPEDTIIHVEFSSAYAGGSITVQALNMCGQSIVRSLPVKMLLPGTTSKIYGDPEGVQGNTTPADSKVCTYVASGTHARYSIHKDPHGLAEGYEWELSDMINARIAAHPGGTGANDTLVELEFDPTFTTAILSVRAVRACGNGPWRSITLVKNPPATPGVITGNFNPCPFEFTTYTVPDDEFSFFEWTVPSTMTIIFGHGTNMITVMGLGDFTGGNIRVQTTSACGTSGVRIATLSACTPPEEKLPVTKATTISEEAIAYPNPSRGKFRIAIPEADHAFGNAMIRVLHRSGRVVMHAKHALRNGFAELDLTGKVTSGWYLVEVNHDGKTIRSRIIIE